MEVAPHYKLFTLLTLLTLFTLFKQLWIKKGNYMPNNIASLIYGLLSKVME